MLPETIIMERILLCSFKQGNTDRKRTRNQNHAFLAKKGMAQSHSRIYMKYFCIGRFFEVLAGSLIDISCYGCLRSRTLRQLQQTHP